MPQAARQQVGHPHGCWSKGDGAHEHLQDPRVAGAVQHPHHNHIREEGPGQRPDPGSLQKHIFSSGAAEEEEEGDVLVHHHLWLPHVEHDQQGHEHHPRAVGVDGRKEDLEKLQRREEDKEKLKREAIRSCESLKVGELKQMFKSLGGPPRDSWWPRRGWTGWRMTSGTPPTPPRRACTPASSATAPPPAAQRRPVPVASGLRAQPARGEQYCVVPPPSLRGEGPPFPVPGFLLHQVGQVPLHVPGIPLRPQDNRGGVRGAEEGPLAREDVPVVGKVLVPGVEPVVLPVLEAVVVPLLGLLSWRGRRPRRHVRRQLPVVELRPGVRPLRDRACSAQRFARSARRSPGVQPWQGEAVHPAGPEGGRVLDDGGGGRRVRRV
mmetsp:Transcript_5645/g.12379  ORF Transcript_5645/g.12379 Transcript_5645/m.12379 type:complete len:379 (-) Transcript_5645:1132-2268(-)